MGTQEQFDFDELPRPIAKDDYIRSTDVEILQNVLYGAAQYKHGIFVLQAIALLSGQATHMHLHPAARIGYMAIASHIRKENGLKLAKSSVKFTVGEMLRLGYVKCLHEAEHGTEAIEYRALTSEGIRATFAAVGATHFRVLRGGRVQLIASRAR